MPSLSTLTQLLTPSPTLRLSALAQSLAASGRPVINLTVGELPFPTFKKAKLGGHEAIDTDFTRYTLPEGRKDVRTKLASRLSLDYQVPVSETQLVLGAGAKYLIYATLQLLLDPGDEVLVPAPYWVSYPSMVDLAQGRMIAVPTRLEQRLLAWPEDLSAHVTNKTKAIIFCSPSNPTGACYSLHEWKLIADWLRQHPDLWVITDDIYNYLYFPQPGRVAPHLLHVAPDLRDRVIAIGGTSKSFCMTGWRLGWALLPEALARLMSQFLSHTTSNPSSLAQHALMMVLDDFQAELSEHLNTLMGNRERVLSFFHRNQLPFVQPDGAFYAFFDVRGRLDQAGVSDDGAWVEWVLQNGNIALVPGKDFGWPGWVRMSIATTPQVLEEALARLENLMSK